MIIVSSQELLLWIEDQLSLGGDKESLYMLIDLVGGISRKEINTLRISPLEKVEIRVKLSFLSNKWRDYINNQIPIQYLSSYVYWRDLKLEVNSNVLIPRVETEQIIDIASNIFTDDKKNIQFLDLGTGSGAIAISLARLHSNWFGIAVDIDKNALEVAQNNFKNLSNSFNLSFYCGNWFEPIKHLEGEIDLIISNPPYIPISIYDALPFGVKNYEPPIALQGGIDGLVHIKKIIRETPRFLKRGGWLILENHFDQGEKIKKLFIENEFSCVENVNDSFGIGRFTIGRYK